MLSCKMECWPIITISSVVHLFFSVVYNGEHVCCLATCKLDFFLVSWSVVMWARLMSSELKCSLVSISVI